MPSDAPPDVRIQFDSTRPIWINCQQKKKTFIVVSTFGRFIKLWRWRLVQTAATRHERIHQISKFYLFTSFFFRRKWNAQSGRPPSWIFTLKSPPTGGLERPSPTGGTPAVAPPFGRRFAPKIRWPTHEKGKRIFHRTVSAVVPDDIRSFISPDPKKKLAALHSHRIN